MRAVHDVTGLHGRWTRAPPSQYRAYPRQDLARAGRFRHVIVGAQFERDDAVHFTAKRGEHDDGGRGGILHERPEHRQPVLARHHHVEDDQVAG